MAKHDQPHDEGGADLDDEVELEDEDNGGASKSGEGS
jgi:hypothetical protein